MTDYEEGLDRLRTFLQEGPGTITADSCNSVLAVAAGRAGCHVKPAILAVMLRRLGYRPVFKDPLSASYDHRWHLFLPTLAERRRATGKTYHHLRLVE